MKNQPNSLAKWLQRVLFIDPTLSILLVVSIIVIGITAYSSMIKESLPDLKIPIASINTFWHGSSATVMEKEITNKIERELTDLDSLKRYSSGSLFSNSNILVEFEADAPLQESLTQLKSRVDTVTSKLPTASKRPTITQASIRNSPIATFMIYGDIAPFRLNKAAKQLRKELLRIPGIIKVQILGERKEYVRVQLLPDKLHAYKISPSHIANEINKHNLDSPLGIYEGNELPLKITSQNAIYSIEQLANLPILRRDEGDIIRLKDVAIVEKSLLRAETSTSYSKGGSPYTNGIGISILKGDGKDTVDLVEKAIKVLQEFTSQASWKKKLKFSAVGNDAKVIQEELQKTLTSGWQSVVVVFITLFFLLSWREATVAALSIPITFLGSIIMLWALGYTFNVMMIIGMVLALGLLVDDFILVMEGMHDGQCIKKLPFNESAILSINNLAIPSLSGTITTIFTFLPLATIGGLDGKFLRSIPVAATTCLVVSYIVSIVISIPLSQFLFRGCQNIQKQSKIDALTHKIESHLTEWLSNNVVFSKKKLRKWLLIGLGTVVLGLVLGSLLPMTLYPLADGRDIGITIELPIDYKLNDSENIANKIGTLLKDKPYFSSILLVVGERDFVYEGSTEDLLGLSTSPNMIGFTILFSEKKDRDKLAYQYVPELRKELEEALSNVPGYKLYITAETGASNNEDSLQLNISGPDLERLQEISGEIRTHLERIDGLNDIRDTIGQTNTEATIIPNIEILDLYNITTEEFNNQLSFYLGDYKLTKLRSDNPTDDLDIRIDTYWSSKNGKQGGPENWSEWESIHILNNKGEWIPLSSLAEMRLTQMPRTISHKNGMRNITIMGTTMTLSFKELFDKVDPILRKLKGTWGEEYEYKWAGEVELAEETYGNSEKAFVIAVLAVLAILVLQFRSFLQPLIILCTIVFGVAGVCFGFTLLAYPLSFPALIGIIALVGINVNDGIVLVDTMNRQHRSGRSVKEAASLGAAERFRPIVSTTLTTLFGLIPLAIADEAWRPLCSAIIFGELLSTAAAMIMTPALYCILTKEEIQSHSS